MLQLEKFVHSYMRHSNVPLTIIYHLYYAQNFNPLTAVAAKLRFDAITHAAIHQTCPDKFLTRFHTQCAYSET